MRLIFTKLYLRPFPVPYLFLWLLILLTDFLILVIKAIGQIGFPRLDIHCFSGILLRITALYKLITVAVSNKPFPFTFPLYLLWCKNGVPSCPFSAFCLRHSEKWQEP